MNVFMSALRFIGYMLAGLFLVGGVVSLWVLMHSPTFLGIAFIGAAGYAWINLGAPWGFWAGMLVALKKELGYLRILGTK